MKVPPFIMLSASRAICMHLISPLFAEDCNRADLGAYRGPVFPPSLSVLSRGTEKKKGHIGRSTLAPQPKKFWTGPPVREITFTNAVTKIGEHEFRKFGPGNR